MERQVQLEAGEEKSAGQRAGQRAAQAAGSNVMQFFIARQTLCIFEQELLAWGTTTELSTLGRLLMVCLGVSVQVGGHGNKL